MFVKLPPVSGFVIWSFPLCLHPVIFVQNFPKEKHQTDVFWVLPSGSQTLKWVEATSLSFGFSSCFSTQK